MEKNISKSLLLIGFLIFGIITISILTPYLSGKRVDTQKMLDEMTLEEKVGQLFIFGFWGKEPDYYITKMIRERYVGGVILLGYNIDSEEQVKQLTTNLQGMSKNPLFISVDQEGGEVARIWFEDTYDISQYNIDDEQEAFRVARNRGQQLRALGINMNFSPVLDHITNEQSFLFTRSFRGTPQEVSKLAISMVKGYKSAGIVPCVKHFPGHSNMTLDSHSQLDSIDISADELDEYIFQFKEVLKYTDAVMTGHILFPKIDKDSPASVSSFFVDSVLRKNLGFDGLIITDDMQMKSIYDLYSVREAAVKAVLVGNDILIYTGEPEEQAEAYGAVLEAVREGVIKEEDLDRKVLKILNIKYSLK